jgi:hypothetical protein
MGNGMSRHRTTCGALGALLATVALGAVGAPVASAGSWLAPVDLRPGVTGVVGVSAVAAGREGTVLAAWTEVLAGHVVVRTAVRAPGGAFSAPQTISDPAGDASGPTVAVDAQGNATVVWVSDAVVHGAYHPVGGTWGASQELSVSGAAGATLAAGADGGAIAVWSRANQVEGAIRPNGAALFGLASAISDVGLDLFGSPRAAIDAAGDVAVTWMRQYDVGGGTNRYVQEATAKGASQAFPVGGPGRIAVSSTSAAVAGTGSFDVRITPAGHVLAIYDDVDGSSVRRVYIRERPLGSSFATSSWAGSSTAISDAGRAYAAVALDDAGGAQAVWLQAGIVEGATRPALGAFAAAPLSAPNANPPAVAGSPAGDATAVWVTAGAGATLSASHRAPGDGFAEPVVLDTAVPGSTPSVGLDANAPVAVDDQGNAYVLNVRTVGGSARTLRAFTYDNAAPTIGSVSVPAALTVGQAGALTATATDRVATTPAYGWSFGDGATGSGPSVTHAYASPGTYTATVTVTDAVGNAASAARQVTVSAPAAPAPVPPSTLPIGPPGNGPTPPAPSKAVPVNVSASWLHLRGGATGVKKLTLTKLVAGETITLSCRGGGCTALKAKARRRRVTKKDKKGTVSLLAAVRKLKLSPKATLAITVARKGYTSKTFTYTMVKGKDPKRLVR